PDVRPALAQRRQELHRDPGAGGAAQQGQGGATRQRQPGIATAGQCLIGPATMSAADHLQVPRQHGLFLHHGIDLGDGSVAHYLEGREILRSPLADFSRGEPVAVVAYPASSCSPAGVTLRRAMGRLRVRWPLSDHGLCHLYCTCQP
ncbi:MAG: hypothetical protein RL688_414, partial [Actinomycetota bacterium]